MNAPLYTAEILRLAASLPDPQPLERVDGRSEQRSPTCGSRVVTEVMVTPDGKIEAVRQQVHACAFGQASATLLARDAGGRGLQDIETTVDELAAWLAGASERPRQWPGLEALAPARSRTARHGAILLPFRALAESLRSAGA